MKGKKVIHVVIALALLVSVSAISAWLFSTQGQASPESGAANADLREYELYIDNTTVSNEIFEQILLTADGIISKYDSITFNKNLYLERYIESYEYLFSELVEVGEDSITMDISNLTKTYTTSDGRETFTTTQDISDKVKYLIALAFITREYEDCIGMHGYFPNPELNHIPGLIIFVCPDYAKSGYDSPTKYYYALRSDECEWTYDAYIVGGGRELIYGFKDGSWTQCYGKPLVGLDENQDE